MTTTTYRAIRKLLAGVLASILAVAGLTALATPAAAADGTLDITVTFEGGAPATDGWVSVYDPISRIVADSYLLTSADAGHHAFALPPGDYNVGFHAFDGYLGEEYHNGYWAGAATVVTVGDGATTYISEELVAGGWIQGTVTVEGGAPASGDMGRVNMWLVEPGVSTLIESAIVDQTGFFRNSRLLAPGDYAIEFTGFDNGVDEYHHDDRWGMAATLVTVTGGAVSVVNEELTAGGYIAGTVTLDTGGTAGVGQVWASDGEGDVVAYTFTDADGAYVLGAVPSGDYYIEFREFDAGAREWHDNAVDLASATPVHVTVGETTTLDASLGFKSTISGTVTLEGGAAATGGTILMTDMDGNLVFAVNPDDSGVYLFTEVPAGTYRLEFASFDGAVDEYYENASYSTATPIVVVPGDRLVIDAELAVASGGTVRATVTAPGGIPADGGCVTAVLDGNLWDPFSAYSTCDGVAGVYEIEDLPAGGYMVGYSGFPGAVDGWLNPWGEFGIDWVWVEDGAMTDVSIELTLGGTLSGTVTDSLGNPVENVTVEVHPAVGYESGYAVTDADGYYETSTLPVGDYKVHFTPEGDLAQVWYDTAASQSSAAWVPVTVGGNTVADQVIPQGATVFGTVTAEAGGSTYGAWVNVYDMVGGFAGYAAVSDVDGTYAVTNLLPGDYRVSFGSPFQALTTEWWDDAPDSASSTVITLASGDAFEANVELSAGPSVSGFVTDAVTGEPVAGVYVNLEGPFYNGAMGYTDANGYYEIATSGLPTNNFYVRAFDTNWSAKRAAEYYGGGYTLATATPIALSDGAIVTGIDIALDVKGTVSGRVTGVDHPEGFSPRVSYWRVDEPNPTASSWVFTSPDGTFTTDDMAPGDYYFAFATTDVTGYASEFWNDSTTLAGATVVSVPAGGTVDGINAVLDRGAIISGRVVDEDNPTVGLGGVFVRVMTSEGVVLATNGPTPSSNLWESSAFTDADGYYTVDVGVGPGDYVVEFVPAMDAFPAGFASEYWGDTSFAEDANVLSIVDGSPVTVDGALSMGGTISGTITHDGLSPVNTSADHGAGARAFMLNTSTGEWEEFGVTDAEPDGTYTIPGLAAGTYRVGFHSHSCNTGYLPDYWNGYDPTIYFSDALTIGDAEDVVVTGGTDTAGVDGFLRSLHVPPTIATDGLAPATGASTGGTVVTITGEHLRGVTSVTFDGVEGTALSIASDTEITVTAPAHEAGPVDVVVTSPEGSSDPATFTYVGPAVVLTGPATYVPGERVTVSVSVDPALSGRGVVWYMPEGGVWTESTKTVKITNGVGSTSLKPKGVMSYRIVFRGDTSNVVTMSPIPLAVTLSGPATYVPGERVTVSVSVDPALSGRGVVWYMPEGGVWTKSMKTVKIIDGVGSTKLKPKGVMSYRIVFKGNTSDAYTVSPV